MHVVLGQLSPGVLPVEGDPAEAMVMALLDGWRVVGSEGMAPVSAE